MILAMATIVASVAAGEGTSVQLPSWTLWQTEGHREPPTANIVPPHRNSQDLREPPPPVGAVGLTLLGLLMQCSLRKNRCCQHESRAILQHRSKQRCNPPCSGRFAREGFGHESGLPCPEVGRRRPTHL